MLRELGSQLIDIHSQHQNLILGSEAFRTQAVDTVAENHDLRMQYTTLYERLCHLRRELARLREEAEAGRKDEEWLRYQVEELAAAHLKEGEQTELEQELEVLSNADRISETLTRCATPWTTNKSGCWYNSRPAKRPAATSKPAIPSQRKPPDGSAPCSKS